MTGRAEWIAAALLAAVVAILGYAVSRPGPPTASFDLIVPIAPPLVRVGEAPVRRGESAPVAVESGTSTNPSAAGDLQLPPSVVADLEQLVDLRARWIRLDARRRDGKLAAERTAAQFGELLTAEQMGEIYRDRIALVRQYGEGKDLESRIAAWKCPEETRNDR